jgi:2-iminoacetate synthase
LTLLTLALESITQISRVKPAIMTFSQKFHELPIAELLARSREEDSQPVQRTLERNHLGLRDFAVLISPGANKMLEVVCSQSQRITRQRFGKVIRLFAPLYLSNECINNCKYCGFSRDNPIFRVTLSVNEVLAEGRALASQGFRNVLLVAGEHPKFVSSGYLADCVRTLHPEIPSLSLEIGPMETSDYKPIVAAGAEGLVVYQETYDRTLYSELHTAGPKRDFDWRLDTPERAHAAGFRKLGIGALFGLSDWRLEALYLAAHADFLLKNCWTSQLTISLPRLRPNAGEFEPLTQLSNRELLQLICAFRLTFPDVGLVLSTREPAKLRDGLIPTGITHISAGSHTEPGGYTGAGKDSIHHTERGRIVALANGAPPPADDRRTSATGQFDIADERSPSEVAELVRHLGYEPVWKDWDRSLSS